MSYYILPKINNDIAIVDVNACALYPMNELQPFVSYSLHYYLQDVKNQTARIQAAAESDKDFDEPCYTLDQLIKAINPYEFIFTKLPHSKFSVSKLKPFSSLFYDLLEIIHTLNLFDSVNHGMVTAHFGKNNLSSIDCINMVRETHKDTHHAFPDFSDETISTLGNNHMDFLYLESGGQSGVKYMAWFLEALVQILTLQKPNGIAILKMEDIYYKPVLDILYILCRFYEKVYLIKPNSSNIVLSDKFIVCKKFTSDPLPLWIHDLTALHAFVQQDPTRTLDSLIQNKIPYFFINKLEEFNIIAGQQQLNAYNQIINLLKTKNKEDKIETYKKSNIQKCISWCEKYKIPNNKFNEKNNIFLPLIKIEKEEIPIEDEPEMLSSSI